MRLDIDSSLTPETTQAIIAGQWREHGGGLCHVFGTAAKITATCAGAIGIALLVAEPVCGITLLYKALFLRIGGKSLKAGARTYGETLAAGAAGHQATATQMADRFRHNYHAERYRPLVARSGRPDPVSYSPENTTPKPTAITQFLSDSTK